MPSSGIAPLEHFIRNAIFLFQSHVWLKNMESLNLKESFYYPALKESKDFVPLAK